MHIIMACLFGPIIAGLLISYFNLLGISSIGKSWEIKQPTNTQYIVGYVLLSLVFSGIMLIVVTR